MITTALKLNTTVLSGHRIEFTAPNLPEGANVEVLVTLPHGAPETANVPRQFKDALEFLDSLPKVNHSAEEWEAIEREFREDRDSWDR